MEPFISHRGIVTILDRSNVDTDQIIPKQFLKSIRRTGFGPSLFFDWRYDAKGNPDPAFELNHPRFENASILVTRNNFGCGSSREHAVWAIQQDGYKVVIAPSMGEGDARVPAFADIFRNNAGKNGLLTVELTKDAVDEIFAEVETEEKIEATVDLEEQIIILHGHAENTYPFEIDATVKDHLIHGLNEIALTLEYQDAIRQFEDHHDVQMPASS